MYRVQELSKGSSQSLPTYCRPVVLPAHSLRSASLPNTPSLPSSSLQTPSTGPLIALPSQQLHPITSQLYLGSLTSLQNPYLLQQAAIRHAVVISSCRDGEGMHPSDRGLPVLGDLLQWLLTESDRARGLAVCTAGGMPCKMIPVQLSEQVPPTS